MADAIVKVVATQFGDRPFRVHIDPSTVSDPSKPAGGERTLTVGLCPYMDDPYKIFRARLAAGVTSLHPHRWLTSTLNSDPPWTLDCRLDRLSLFEPAAHESAPLLIIKNAAIWNTDQGRYALRTTGRVAVEGGYLAHPVLTDCYWAHQPTGVGIQDAPKDLLTERIRGLRLEVRTPVGAADAATDAAVFGMARWETWKQAMGQLLAYAAKKGLRDPFRRHTQALRMLLTC